MATNSTYGEWVEALFSAKQCREGGAEGCKVDIQLRAREVRGLNWGGSPNTGQDMHMPEWRGVEVQFRPVSRKATTQAAWRSARKAAGGAAPLLDALKAGGSSGFRVVNTWILGGA